MSFVNTSLFCWVYNLGLCFLEDAKYSLSSSISVAVKKSDVNIIFSLKHCCWFYLDAC